MLLDQQTRAIVWVQYRSIFNRFPRNRGGAVLAWFFSIVWYSIFAMFGVLAAFGLPEVTDRAWLLRTLDLGLLVCLLFWQLMPLMMATSGLSLDLKRLFVYPIPERRMFGIEVLLRASTGIEVLILLTGAAIGLWRNPIVPWWGPLFFVPFTAFNLCLSAGMRDLLTRLLRKRGVREVVVLGLLLLTQLPNLLVRTVPAANINAYLQRYSALSAALPLPWQWTARLASGESLSPPFSDSPCGSWQGPGSATPSSAEACTSTRRRPKAPAASRPARRAASHLESASPDCR